MDEINFDTNYNNKLDCVYYTTIRKKSEKYIRGNIYQINLNNKPIHKSLLIDIKLIDINKKFNNDYYFELDTGMNYYESKKLFGKLNIEGICMLLLLKKMDEDKLEHE